MSNFTMGNLYDINKNLMKNEKILTEEELDNKLKEIKQNLFIHNHVMKNKKYFMLLCHDYRDYTVFNLQTMGACTEAMKALKDCIQNRGSAISIDKLEGDAYEIWIKINNDAYCYYLFPFDEGIIEC